MRVLVVFAAFAAFGLASAAPVGSEEPEAPRLRFNPFEEGEGGHAHGRSRGVVREEAWEPVLRATLFAGEASVANLGGVVLGIGEQTHGYKLVAVREFGAVFERSGERIELEVTPPASRGQSGAGR